MEDTEKVNVLPNGYLNGFQEVFVNQVILKTLSLILPSLNAIYKRNFF